jgi:hypothetical protein
MNTILIDIATDMKKIQRSSDCKTEHAQCKGQDDTDSGCCKWKHITITAKVLDDVLDKHSVSVKPFWERRTSRGTSLHRTSVISNILSRSYRLKIRMGQDLTTVHGHIDPTLQAVMIIRVILLMPTITATILCNIFAKKTTKLFLKFSLLGYTAV